jgi:hypothetical protein
MWQSVYYDPPLPVHTGVASITLAVKTEVAKNLPEFAGVGCLPYPAPCPVRDAIVDSIAPPYIVDALAGLEAALVGTNAGGATSTHPHRPLSWGMAPARCASRAPRTLPSRF